MKSDNRTSPDRGSDKRAIACNVAHDAPAFSCGALALVVQLAGDRAKVVIHSRSGRWITRWLPVSKLANFRFKEIPPEHSRYRSIGDVGNVAFFTDDDLAALANCGAGQGLRLR